MEEVERARQGKLFVFAAKKSIVCTNSYLFTFPFSFSFRFCDSACFPYLRRFEGYFLFPEMEGEAMTPFGCVDDGSGGAGGASWWFRLVGHR